MRLRRRGPTVDLPCRFCDGTGKGVRRIWTDDLSIAQWTVGSRDVSPTCIVCNGKGMVRLRIPDTPTDCGGCQGTGRQAATALCEDVDQRSRCPCGRCWTCQGYGMLSMTGRIEEG
jgi:hypothetical protein